MKNEKVIMIVGTEPRAMCKKEEKDYYMKIFKATEVIEGSFKKGKPEGVIAKVAGIFTSTEEQKFVVYSDWSVNKIENTDPQGYPL
jgi:hypothetical protein